MTKQEIINELNAAKHRGFGVWHMDSHGRYVSADGDESIMIFPSEARKIAEKHRRNREALSLDAVMPLLEQIALCGDGRQDATRVGFFLEGGGFTDVGVGTTFADVAAVVDAWKARRA